MVVDVVRGLDVEEALNRLDLLRKKAVKPVAKLINSSIANAEHSFNAEKNNLFIKTIKVDEGPTLYRWMPRAHGRATPLRKKTSIISLILDEKVPTVEAKKDKSKKPEAVKVQKVKGSEPVEKVADDKERINEELKSEKTNIEGYDHKRKGGFRDVKSQEKDSKKEKGFLNKVFRRKSGM